MLNSMPVIYFWMFSKSFFECGQCRFDGSIAIGVDGNLCPTSMR